MKKIICISIIIFLTDKTFANNYQIIDYPYNANYSSISSSGGLVFFSCNRLLLCDSTFSKYEKVISPYGKVPFCGLFLNQDSFFVFTSDWILYLTINGGACYDSIYKFNKQITEFKYFDGVICALGYDTGSYQGVLYTSSDFGNTFNPIGVPLITFIDFVSPIYFNRDTIFWPTANNSGTGYIDRTYNGGASWHTVYEEPSYDEIYDCDFWDVNNGIVWGDDGLFRTTNGGAGWSALPGVPEIQGKLKMISADSVLFIADNYLYISPDGGNTWNIAKTIGTTEADLSDIYRISFDPSGQKGLITSAVNQAGFGYAEYSGRVFGTLNGGYNWQSINYGFNNQNVLGTVNDSTLFGFSDHILFSKDTGQVWGYSDVSGYVANIIAVTFVNDSTGFLCGTNNSGTAILIETTNAGQSWQLISSNIGGSGPQYIKFFDEDTGYINFANGCYRTINGGVAFQALSNYSHQDIRVSFATPDTGFSVLNNGVLLTTNGGASWQLQNSPAANIQNDYFVATSTSRFFILNDSVLYESGNMGLSWTALKTFVQGGEIIENKNRNLPMLFFLPSNYRYYFSINPNTFAMDSFFHAFDTYSDILQQNDSITLFYDNGVIADVDKYYQPANCGFTINLDATSNIGNCTTQGSLIDTFYITGDIDSVKDIIWYRDGYVAASGRGLTQIMITGVAYDEEISVTAGNACGCTQTKQITISEPNAPILEITTDTSLCQGQSMVLLATGTLSNYSWTYGANADTITPSATFIDTVTATDFRDCITTATEDINVIPLPPANTIITTSLPFVLCLYNSVSLGTNFPFASYLWSNGDTTPTITVSDSGTYTLIVSTAPGCTGSTSIYVPLDGLTDSITPPSANIYCHGESVTLTVIPPEPAYTNTYSWSNGAYRYVDYIKVHNAGIFSVTVTDQNGCSASATATVTENFGPITYEYSAEICTGSAYNFNGALLNASGTYNDSLPSSAGCDSIVTLNLQVDTTMVTNLNRLICSGTTYSFNGRVLDASGVYYDTLTAVTGCDSLIILNLQTTSAFSTNLSQSVCLGMNYDFNGRTLNNTGIYYDTLQAAGGCDSIVALNLQVTSGIPTNISRSICQGDTFNFSGHELITQGNYADTLVTVGGCDSIIILALGVNSLPVVAWPGNSDTVYSNGDSILLAGASPAYGVYSGIGVSGSVFYPDSAGIGNHIVTYTYTNSNGCTGAISKNFVVIVSSIDNICLTDRILLYPNPAGDLIVANSDLFTSANMQSFMYDITGKLILVSLEKHNDIIKFNIADLAPGMYWVKFIIDGYEVSKRFVKM